MSDQNWMDNVGPLLAALSDIGLDPVEWAADPDTRAFRDGDGLIIELENEELRRTYTVKDRKVVPDEETEETD